MYGKLRNMAGVYILDRNRILSAMAYIDNTAVVDTILSDGKGE